MKNNILAISLIFLMACGSDETTSTLPQREKLTESVYSSVTIQPDSLYQVYAAVTGILDKIMVEEGDTVAIGDELFQVTNNSPKLNTENARLALKIAEENYSGKNAVLEDMQNEIEVAKLKLTNDSINYIRQKNLWQQKIGSKAEFDAKQLNFQASQNNYNTLVNRYKRTKVELKQQVEQARNNYQSSLILTEDFTIESKINGKVYAINKKAGELISIQQPIATLGSTSKFIAELLIDEVDIAKVKLGQQVLISLDAYPEQVFEAKIHKIYPQKNERSQTFKIEADFTQKPPTLYPGLSGEANIIIHQKENVLVIPKMYLQEENKVNTDDGLVEIKIGLESLDKVEVLSGIDENTTIYLPEE